MYRTVTLLLYPSSVVWKTKLSISTIKTSNVQAQKDVTVYAAVIGCTSCWYFKTVIRIIVVFLVKSSGGSMRGLLFWVKKKSRQGNQWTHPLLPLATPCPIVGYLASVSTVVIQDLDFLAGYSSVLLWTSTTCHRMPLCSLDMWINEFERARKFVFQPLQDKSKWPPIEFWHIFCYYVDQLTHTV